jgi:hypothetical protein
VDWKKIGEVKGGIFARLKMFRGDKAKTEAVLKGAHEIFKAAGMPEDRIDYILEKYCCSQCLLQPSLLPAEPQSEAHVVDKKDCYFDEACHKLVDWKKIGEVKGGIFARLKMFRGDKAKTEAVLKRAHEIFKAAGMPEDRIDYILEKWAKSVADEPQSDEKAVDKKDCYFDEACHKLVDWKKIGEAKEGIFARLKWANGDEAKTKMVMQRAHEIFKAAGVPEDRIDPILQKWAKYIADKPHAEVSHTERSLSRP